MLDARTINEFLHSCLNERLLSLHTFNAYKSDLADFCRWTRTRHDQGSASSKDLNAYLSELASGRKLSSSTIRRRVACLRAFFRYQSEKRQVPNPIAAWRPILPRRRRLPRTLSRQEAELLLAIRMRRKIEAELRIALHLLIATGLRIGELCCLRIEDLSPNSEVLRVHGKGSRERIVYIADIDLRCELTSLSNKRAKALGSNAPLFLNRRGTAIRPQTIRSKLRRLANEAGISRRVTPHMLRHTAATLLIETGVDIRFVQRLLGHSSIATTELYTHVSDEALRATLQRANVLQTLTRP
jgi:integrase/recombinase XerD